MNLLSGAPGSASQRRSTYGQFCPVACPSSLWQIARAHSSTVKLYPQNDSVRCLTAQVALQASQIEANAEHRNP